MKRKMILRHIYRSLSIKLDSPLALYMLANLVRLEGVQLLYINQKSKSITFKLISHLPNQYSAGFSIAKPLSFIQVKLSNPISTVSTRQVEISTCQPR